MYTSTSFCGNMPAKVEVQKSCTIGIKDIPLPICGIDFIELNKTVASLQEYIQKLEAKINELYDYVYYMPDRPGYLKARS